MKRVVAFVVSLALALTSLTGCYGKFALTRKVYGVNGQVQDKYLRNLVTWAFIIVPVYGVSALVDFILFNTIEFWSGHNPVGENTKEFRYAANGENYYITASKTGDTVHYAIRHYQAGTYLDSMTIAWNLQTGNSTALYRRSDKTTEFVASRNGTDIQVQQLVKGDTSSDRHLAAHR